MASVIDDRLNTKNPNVMALFEPKQAEPINMPFYEAPSNQISIPQPPFTPQTFSSTLPSRPVKRKVLSEDEMAQERISTILSLDASGGWIRDIEYNNFYFFYSDVINKTAEELAIGTTLQFRLKFDRIKTEQKDSGEPSYRAIGPIYVVD
jgi:hypothetical protein